ncbi:hypothetical protein D3C84_932400 [compost metagenome]
MGRLSLGLQFATSINPGTAKAPGRRHLSVSLPGVGRGARLLELDPTAIPEGFLTQVQPTSLDDVQTRAIYCPASVFSQVGRTGPPCRTTIAARSQPRDYPGGTCHENQVEVSATYSCKPQCWPASAVGGLWALSLDRFG